MKVNEFSRGWAKQIVKDWSYCWPDYLRFWWFLKGFVLKKLDPWSSLKWCSSDWRNYNRALRFFFIEWGFYNQLYKFWIAWGLSEEGVWKHFCLNEPKSQEFFVTPKWQMMMWSKGSEDMMMVYIDSVDFRYVCPLREVPHALSLTNHLCDPSSVLPNIAGLDIFSSYCFHSDTKPQPGWTLKKVVEFFFK